MRRIDVSSSGQKSPYPVFFDPSHRRWVAFIAVTTMTLSCIVFLMATVTVRIVNGPQVQGFSLSTPVDRVVSGATISIANNLLEPTGTDNSADLSGVALPVAVVKADALDESNGTGLAAATRSDFFLTTEASQQR